MPFDDNAFSAVRVLPYIGEAYDQTSRWALRILILGESHYRSDGGDLGSDFTRGVISQYLGGDVTPALRFFTKVAGLFFGGRRPTREEAKEFWHTAAFYSFIQRSAGTGPRQRPTEETWRQAPEPFREVLTLLAPRLVLALGKELSTSLSRLLQAGAANYTGHDAGGGCVLTIREPGHLIVGINHPAAVGWSYKRWAPCIEAALRYAGR